MVNYLRTAAQAAFAPQQHLSKEEIERQLREIVEQLISLDSPKISLTVPRDAIQDNHFTFRVKPNGNEERQETWSIDISSHRIHYQNYTGEYHRSDVRTQQQLRDLANRIVMVLGPDSPEVEHLAQEDTVALNPAL